MGETGPDLLKRSAAMVGGPPPAQEVKNKEEGYCYAEAHRVAADTVEAEPPVVEQESPDNRLEKVVGQTHFPYRGQT